MRPVTDYVKRYKIGEVYKDTSSGMNEVLQIVDTIILKSPMYNDCITTLVLQEDHPKFHERTTGSVCETSIYTLLRYKKIPKIKAILLGYINEN